jgi:hypothetical protein
VSYTAVNAKRSTKKRLIGAVSKMASHPGESKLSWYQSIDTRHLWVYVKFEGGLSIPFARKLRFKKSETFPEGRSALFPTAELKMVLKM